MHLRKNKITIVTVYLSLNPTLTLLSQWSKAKFIMIAVRVKLKSTVIFSLSLPLSLSLSIRLYRPSLPAGLLDYILCSYRAVVKFLLVVQYLHVRVKGSIGERHWCVRSSPAVSRMSSLSDLDGFRGRWTYSSCFVRFCFQDSFNITRSILVLFSVRLASIN